MSIQEIKSATSTSENTVKLELNTFKTWDMPPLVSPCSGDCMITEKKLHKDATWWVSGVLKPGYADRSWIFELGDKYPWVKRTRGVLYNNKDSWIGDSLKFIVDPNRRHRRDRTHRLRTSYFGIKSMAMDYRLLPSPIALIEQMLQLPSIPNKILLPEILDNIGQYLPPSNWIVEKLTVPATPQQIKNAVCIITNPLAFYNNLETCNYCSNGTCRANPHIKALPYGHFS